VKDKLLDKRTRLYKKAKEVYKSIRPHHKKYCDLHGHKQIAHPEFYELPKSLKINWIFVTDYFIKELINSKDN